MWCYPLNWCLINLSMDALKDLFELFYRLKDIYPSCVKQTRFLTLLRCDRNIIIGDLNKCL